MDGSDAEVITDNIQSALGYIPADSTDITRIDGEIEDLQDAIDNTVGNKENLETENKTNIVSAVNEVKDDVVGLAGEGRTTETVKGNADAIIAMDEGKVSKSGDTMTGRLDMLDNIAIFPLVSTGFSGRSLSFRPDINQPSIYDFMIGANWNDGIFTKGFIGYSSNNNNLEFYNDFTRATKPLDEVAIPISSMTTQELFNNVVDNISTDMIAHTRYDRMLNLNAIILLVVVSKMLLLEVRQQQLLQIFQKVYLTHSRLL